MMWSRTGLTLTLTLLLGTLEGQSSGNIISHHRNQGKIYDDIHEQEPYEQIAPHTIKRSLIGEIIENGPIYEELYNKARGYWYAYQNATQQLEELKRISRQLDALNQKVDNLAQQVGSLGVGQQWLEGAILYGNDVQRLTYFLDFLSRNLHLQDDKSLGPKTELTRWTDAVLSARQDGVDQVLYNFHDMMVGTSHFFGRKPLFLVYESALDVDSSAYWGQVRNFMDFAYSVQTAGYAAWATALNAVGRSSEVTRVQNLGRERLEEQRTVLEPLTIEWPTGSYGLPMTNTGCPVAAGVTWQTGWRKHDTEDDDSSNDWTNPNHFVAKYGRNNMEQHFCMKTGDGDGNWPRGNYCVFRKGTCPSGFSKGSIRWDDEDDNNNNKAGGSLPDGDYGSNTVIHYCCRNDGAISTAIPLPVNAPFFLFRFTAGCQQVQGTDVHEEYFKWDDEDDDNANWVSGNHPFDNGGRNHRIYYCYYSRH